MDTDLNTDLDIGLDTGLDTGSGVGELYGLMQVQQEYHSLFESNTGDPETVTRWRNRALRFVLPSDSASPDVAEHSAPLRPVSGESSAAKQSIMVCVQGYMCRYRLTAL